VVAYFVGMAWERLRDAPWRIAVQAGLVPISIGLLGAGALVLARVADHNWTAFAITLATAAVAVCTRWNPLWAFAVAGLLGIAGFV
jgi:chromate transporter